MENRLAKNRKSPENEADYINAYKQINLSASKLRDGLDIAAVTTKNGTRGYGLMQEELNRSRDRELHRVKDFISTDELKKKMKDKK
jgi:hypothetical protein